MYTAEEIAGYSDENGLDLRQHQQQVGDADHIKALANRDAAERWFEENDPEGVAFEYDVIEG